MAKKRKRLVRGKDYDGWAWQLPSGKFNNDIFRSKADCQYVCQKYLTQEGKPVRVKLVVVERSE